MHNGKREQPALSLRVHRAHALRHRHRNNIPIDRYAPDVIQVGSSTRRARIKVRASGRQPPHDSVQRESSWSYRDRSASFQYVRLPKSVCGFANRLESLEQRSSGSRLGQRYRLRSPHSLDPERQASPLRSYLRPILGQCPGIRDSANFDIVRAPVDAP